MKSEKHKNLPDKYSGTSISELAKDLCEMNYDNLQELLYEMGNNFSEESKQNALINRPKLSKELDGASEYMMITSMFVNEAWKICKPYMK